MRLRIWVPKQTDFAVELRSIWPRRWENLILKAMSLRPDESDFWCIFSVVKSKGSVPSTEAWSKREQEKNAMMKEDQLSDDFNKYLALLVCTSCKWCGSKLYLKSPLISSERYEQKDGPGPHRVDYLLFGPKPNGTSNMDSNSPKTLILCKRKYEQKGLWSPSGGFF